MVEGNDWSFDFMLVIIIFIFNTVKNRPENCSEKTFIGTNAHAEPRNYVRSCIIYYF